MVNTLTLAANQSLPDRLSINGYLIVGAETLWKAVRKGKTPLHRNFCSKEEAIAFASGRAVFTHRISRPMAPVRHVHSNIYLGGGHE